MKPQAWMHLASVFLLAATATTATTAHAADANPRWRDTGKTIRVDGDATLPRFSPDGARLAYAVERAPGSKVVAEIRSRTLADQRERVLLSITTGQREDYTGSYPFRLQWKDATHLVAELGNGDDGSDVHTLDADKPGSQGIEHTLAGEELAPPRAIPGLRALVPGWPQPVFDNAMEYRVSIRDHGALVQKRYAEQDNDLWWLDLRRKTATAVVPEIEGRRLELMDGFAFGAHAVFALRRGDVITAERLAGDGTLKTVAGSELPINVGPEAIGTAAGAVDQRRCSADACWALYRVHRDDSTTARILRLDRNGDAELLAEIPGLEDFDVSPDFGQLAVSELQKGKRRIRLFRIERF